MIIHYDTVAKQISNMELIIPNKLLWLPSLYLTHQEKNKLKCIQQHFSQFGKLLSDKMDCLNEWNKRVEKVKWEKPKSDYL
jgi:hypothetical protein